MLIIREVKALTILLIIFIAVSLYSCRKDLFGGITVNPQVGIPLMKANLSLTDILKSESDSTFYFYSDESNLMHIYFEKNIDTIYARNIFDSFYENDTIINDTIPLDFVNDFYEISTTLDAKVSFEEELDIYKIDSVGLDSCMLMIELFTDPNNFDTLSLEIPTFFDHQGNHVLFEFSSSEYNSRKSFNLNNGNIYLEPSHFTSGLVNLKLYFKFSRKGRILNKQPLIRLFLYDLKIHSFYGKFGNMTQRSSDAIEFMERDEFIMNDNVYIDIEAPEIFLFFKNGFNLPFSFRDLNIKAGNRFSQQFIYGLPSSIDVAAGTNGNYGYGEEMLSQNTNLETVLGSFPDSLYFSYITLFNPGNIETPNSITVNDSLIYGMKGDIPLNLHVSEIYYQRQLDSLNLENILQDFIEAVKFRAVIKNNFPVDISAQLFFVDRYGQKISQAFKNPLNIKSVGQGSEQYYETELSNEFEGEMLNSIRKSKLMMELRFQTSEAEKYKMARFFSTQNIEFNVFVFGKTKFEFF
jgi:hypothetical protein